MTSFVALAEELSFLLREPGIPSEAVDGALRLIQRVDKCLVVKPEVHPAPRTVDPGVLLQPSNLFADFVSAFRARDWPLVRIIEHRVTSAKKAETTVLAPAGESY